MNVLVMLPVFDLVASTVKVSVSVGVMTADGRDFVTDSSLVHVSLTVTSSDLERKVIDGLAVPLSLVKLVLGDLERSRECVWCVSLGESENESSVFVASKLGLGDGLTETENSSLIELELDFDCGMVTDFPVIDEVGDIVFLVGVWRLRVADNAKELVGFVPDMVA